MAAVGKVNVIIAVIMWALLAPPVNCADLEDIKQQAQLLSAKLGKHYTFMLIE